MSIESSIQRIVDAKTAIISAINEQLNGETVPDDIKVQGLAAYIISACEIQYNLGLSGGGGQESYASSYVINVYGPYDGTYTENGTANGKPKFVGTYAVLYYNGSMWCLGQDANGTYDYFRNSTITGEYTRINGEGPEITVTAGSGGGGGGGGTNYVVSGPPFFYGNLLGTYEPYNMGGYDGTQTYKMYNGNGYMYRFRDDDGYIGWCIRNGGIGDYDFAYSYPPSGAAIYVLDNSTTPPTNVTWTDGERGYTVEVAS